MILNSSSLTQLAETRLIINAPLARQYNPLIKYCPPFLCNVIRHILQISNVKVNLLNMKGLSEIYDHKDFFV